MDRWSLSEKEKLIRLYEKFPLLWNPCHSLYGKKTPRLTAIRKIAAEFTDRGQFFAKLTSVT